MWEDQSAVALAGLILGAAFGATVERTHFCTMGAVSDVVLFGSGRRARIWLTATLVVVLAVLGLQFSTDFVVADTPWRQPIGLVSLLVGGLLFGIGMVLAGGCVSRTMVRLGTGSLKALVVLLVVAVAAAAALLGILAPLSEEMRASAAMPVLAALPDWPVAVALLIVGSVIVALDPRFRSLHGPLGAGIVLGLPVAGAWWATQALAQDPFSTVVATSMTFVAPTAQALWWITVGETTIRFGLAAAGGVVLGAALSAALAKRWRLEAFSDLGDLGRHLVGGACMGVGGVLAGGCTVGQGMTGISTLAVGSFLAVAAMIAGATLTLQIMVHGSPIRMLAQRWRA